MTEPAGAPPFHICFVCSGNICRSPYAEAMFRRLAEEHGLGERLRASSLGTLGIEGVPAHEWTLEVAAERGSNLIAFRSRALDADRAAEADLLVALGEEHLAAIAALDEDLPRPPRLWLITAPGVEPPPAGEAGIPDPVGAEPDEYRRALAAIDEALPPLLDAVRRLAGV